MTLSREEVLESLGFEDESLMTRIDWHWISHKSNLSEEEIDVLSDDLEWDVLVLKYDFSEDFIKKQLKQLKHFDINSLVTTQKLSEDFIRTYESKMSWVDISMYQSLSENFIREFQGRVRWTSMAKHQKLSEGFIEEFEEVVSWSIISRWQKLSEDFIRKHQNYISMKFIWRYQKFSEDFIKECKGEEYIDDIFINKNTSKNYIRKNISKLNEEVLKDPSFRKKFTQPELKEIEKIVTAKNLFKIK